MKFKAYIANRQTHKTVAAMTITADGYLTALQESQELCKKNYTDSYVSRVEKE